MLGKFLSSTLFVILCYYSFCSFTKTLFVSPLKIPSIKFRRNIADRRPVNAVSYKDRHHYDELEHRVNDGAQLYMSPTADSNDGFSASSNVDLFSKTSSPAPLPKNAVESSGSGSGSIKNAKRPSSSNNSAAKQQEEIASKAELLRLEANQEQSIIDAQIIMKEKNRLKEVDMLIINIYDGKLAIGNEICREYPQLLCTELFLRIAELVNAASSIPEKERFTEYFNSLTDAVKEFDSSLHADIQADIEKRLMQRQYKMKETARKEGLDEGSGYDELVVKAWVDQLNGAPAPGAVISRDYEQEDAEKAEKAEREKKSEKGKDDKK
jgi:hypothetical protein